VICEICQSATVLDPESATELLEIYQENQMQTHSLQQPHNESEEEDVEEALQAQTYS